MTYECSALYNHTSIRNGNKVYPCCRFKKQLTTFDGDVENILNSKEYIELRERFKHEKLPECSKCWEQEEKGIKSVRQYFNEDFNCDEVKLRYLEIGFDNICNMKCVMCGPEYSNQFTGETITTKPLYNVPNLEKLIFLGGEPLMNKRYLRFLKNLNRQNLDLTIITNGMFKLTDDWKTLLRECRKVKFFVSVDGYGKLNEQTRIGSKWNIITETVKDLETEWKVVINTIVHKKNFKGMKRLKEWVGDRIWQINILTYPTHLKINEEQEKELTINFKQYFGGLI